MTKYLIAFLILLSTATLALAMDKHPCMEARRRQRLSLHTIPIVHINGGTLKRLLIAILLIFIAYPVWGASTTCYVSTSGDTGNSGLTPALAKALPSQCKTVLAAIAPTGTGAGQGHTLYTEAGTYVDANGIDLSSANMDGSRIIGVADLTSLAPASKGQVIVSASGAPSIYSSRANIAIQNMSATTTGAVDCFDFNGATANTLTNSYCYNSAGRLLSVRGAATLTTNTCKFEGSTNTTSPIRIGNTANWTSNYDIITNSATMLNAGSIGIYNYGTGTVILNNDVVLGMTGVPIYMDAAGTFTVNNSIIGASLVSGRYTARRIDGTMTFNNSMLMQNWETSHYVTNGTITANNSITTLQPKFVNRPRKGIIVLAMDDGNNIDYMQTIEAVFAANGIKGSAFLDTYSLTGTTLTKAQSLYANGTIDLIPHSSSHSDLALADDTTIWTLTNCTVTNDRTGAGTITIGGGGSGTINNVRTTLLSSIKSNLEAGGCTVASTNYGASTGKINTVAIGEVLKTAAAGSTTLKLLVDTTAATGLYKAEIVDALTAMQAAFPGYSTSGFATPYGTTSANLITGIKNAGYTGNRSAFVAATTTGYKLATIDLYSNMYVAINTYITDGAATDAQVATRTRAIAEAAAQEGWIIYLLAHSATECTAAQWQIIIDTLKEYSGDISIMTMSEAINYIKTSGLWRDDGTAPDATGSDSIWSRTWTDGSNYSLRAGSPAINAGTTIAGLTTDYAGNTVPMCGATDIGAYERQTCGSGGKFNINWGFGF